METSIKLTVFFEDPYWVGIFERTSEGSYAAIKVTFGSEPKDYEVYDFIQKNFYKLRFNNSSLLDKGTELTNKKMNPKRLQRMVKKETSESGIGTKAQLAIKLEYESNKLERKKTSREEKEQEKERKFQLRQHKKLVKHQGH